MDKKPVVSVQLYTLRDMIASDMAGTLRELAAIGYSYVETAGYGNLNVHEMRAALRENNLKVSGILVSIEAMQEDLQLIIDEAHLLETRYVTCPYLVEEWRNKEGYLTLAKTFSEIGARLHDAGLQLCYHNHAFEFERYDEQYGLDLLFENSDPQFLQAEIDTYWVQSAGLDPADYIRKYSGRVPLLHIKDMAADEEKSFAEIGTGILHWDEIFAAAEASGVGAYVIEQDICPGDPLDSLRISYANLKKFGKIS
jgi:sugar phosphate isomerase/epimerase